MTTFDERQRTEERKFQLDQEITFKIRNRRNKLFGLWVAQEHLKLSEAEQADYAKAVVMADFERPGDGDVIDKVKADLDAKGIGLTAHILEKHLRELEAIARDQVMKE
jgi:hypothetical protein